MFDAAGKPVIEPESPRSVVENKSLVKEPSKISMNNIKAPVP